MSYPASNSTTSYTKINGDSITVVGAVGAPSNPSGATPTGPVGVKLSWAGDTLLMKVSSSISQTISQGGASGLLTGTVEGVTKLKRR